jgi:hypothetical protein
MNYRGFDISTDGKFFYWELSGQRFNTLEDVQSDIEDYFDMERESERERMAEDQMERELLGE